MTRIAVPVARLLRPVVWSAAVVIAALAVVGIGGGIISVRSVDYLTDHLQPAANANDDVMRDMLDMETGVRAWVNTGDPAALDPYLQGRLRIQLDQRRLESFAHDHPELADLVERQGAAVSTWQEQYAGPRLAGGSGARHLDPGLSALGTTLFDEFRASQAATTRVLDTEIRESRAAADLRLWGTVGAFLLATVLGLALLGHYRRRAVRQIVGPLTALHRVVQQIEGQEPSARAEEEGPVEVREIARSLNQLADSHELSRQVEHRIQSELRSLDAARSDFVANVSHELRTPLTALRGYLELVTEEFEGRMDPTHERMVRASNRSLERLNLLIEDLLTLSKAESSSTDLERVDLGPILEEAVADVRLTAGHRGIAIVMNRVGRGQALVLGDRIMLYRALLNVLSNAVKFSPADEVVEVRLALDGDEIVVAISDHGIGIPLEEQGMLGTRFFRASNAVSSAIAGTGLGIRIVQTVVDRHAGSMRLESAENEGTTITLRFPRQHELSDPSIAPPMAREEGIPERQPALD